MHTGSLLTRLQQLRLCEESLEDSDMYPEEVRHDMIVFKRTEEWICAYRDVKSVLENREHRPTAQERVAARGLRSKRRSHGRRDR